MKYLIHAYPSRMWYVNDFIVPSLLAQGIAKEDISIWNDEEHKGNLFAFIDSLKALQNEPGGTWHLQDDIVICRDFKKLTEENDEGIVCGYCCINFQLGVKAGVVPAKEQWYSFPCIRIPNEMISGFLEWFANNHLRANYARYTREKKFDDFFFLEYCRLCCGEMTALNLKPNLVDHVDYLIGGTLVNKQRIMPVNRAAFFPDPDLVDELEEKLNEMQEAR